MIWNKTKHAGKPEKQFIGASWKDTIMYKVSFNLRNENNYDCQLSVQ